METLTNLSKARLSSLRKAELTTVLDVIQAKTALDTSDKDLQEKFDATTRTIELKDEIHKNRVIDDLWNAEKAIENERFLSFWNKVTSLKAIPYNFLIDLKEEQFLFFGNSTIYTIQCDVDLSIDKTYAAIKSPLGSVTLPILFEEDVKTITDVYSSIIGIGLSLAVVGATFFAGYKFLTFIGNSAENPVPQVAIEQPLPAKEEPVNAPVAPQPQEIAKPDAAPIQVEEAKPAPPPTLQSLLSEAEYAQARTIKQATSLVLNTDGGECTVKIGAYETPDGKVGGESVSCDNAGALVAKHYETLSKPINLAYANMSLAQRKDYATLTSKAKVVIDQTEKHKGTDTCSLFISTPGEVIADNIPYTCADMGELISQYKNIMQD